MFRTIVILSTAAMIAAPAVAETYVAKPATAPTEAKIAGREMRWMCGDGTCRGTTDQSRPIVLCQDLAKRTGPMESFVVNGGAFSADELAKCNAAAKHAAKRGAKTDSQLASAN